jgi:carboxyl-terminal processing protease
MKRYALAFSVFLGIFALGFFAAPGPAAPDKKSDTFRYLDLFGAVFERVRNSYVTDVSDKKLIEAAISGMLRSLDPHSSYMSAEGYKEMGVRTRGKFGGLGIVVTMDKGVIKVVSPIDDTPAAKAGVQSGDLITHIDGKPIQGMDLREAVTQMRGKVGTKIKIRVRRKGVKPFDITLTRAIITIKSVRHRLEGNVGYIRVTSFTQQSDVGLRRAIEEFKAKRGKKLIGIVLDLRNNPGGLLSQAVKITDVFLAKGEIVSTRGRSRGASSRYNAEQYIPGDLTNGLPIIVLINGGSASASEIVAGALQDHKRAIIMGTRSFGKGSVQRIIQLAGQGAMRLTTARYYTPKGRTIQAKGVEPDIKVEQATLQKIKRGPQTRERDLRGALDTKKNRGPKKDDKADKKSDKPKPSDPKDAKKDGKKDDKAATSKTATKKRAILDYQLSRAVDLLRGLALIRSRSATIKQ